MMVIVAPSNPQTYNRQVFLFTSLLSRRRSCRYAGVAQRRSCLHRGTYGATRAGPDRHRERAARRAAVSGLGRQERRERNALAKNPRPTRDELLRINRRSSRPRPYSGPFVSVTVRAAIRWSCRRSRPLSIGCGSQLARRARAAALCRIRNRHSPSLSQGLCGAPTAVP